MPRFYVEKDGEWNIFSTIIDGFVFDEFVCLDALKARLLYERYKELTEDIDSLLTDRPRVNVMSYSDAIERIGEDEQTEPQTEGIWNAGYKTGYDKGYKDAQKVKDSQDLVKDLVKTENSSEIPNNCKYAENPSGDVWECGCFLDTYCEHQIYDRNPDGTINIVKCGYEPKTEPFAKDINVRSKDEPQTERKCIDCMFLTYMFGKTWCNIKCENPHDKVCDRFKPKYEPQTERSE